MLQALPKSLKKAFEDVASKAPRSINLPKELRSLLQRAHATLPPGSRRLLSLKAHDFEAGDFKRRGVWVDFGIHHLR